MCAGGEGDKSRGGGGGGGGRGQEGGERVKSESDVRGL